LISRTRPQRHLEQALRILPQTDDPSAVLVAAYVEVRRIWTDHPVFRR
jgi:hypothetical protein